MPQLDLPLTEAGKRYLGSLKFNEDDHTYVRTDTGESLVSVTQLLALMGLAPDYSKVRRKVLSAAADRGKEIHREIEEYNRSGLIGFTPESQFYVTYVEENGITPVLSECCVADSDYAGTFDELWRDKDGKYILVDNKTTSSLHDESVSWQLSLYAHALEADYGIAVSSLGAMWLPEPKYGKPAFIEVPRKDIDGLLDAYRKGVPYRKGLPCQADVIAEAEAWKEESDRLAEAKKEADARLKELSEQILDGMGKNGCRTFDTGYAKFTLVERKAPSRFDVDRYAKDHPGFSTDGYMAEGKASKSLKITMKGNTEK